MQIRYLSLQLLLMCLINVSGFSQQFINVGQIYSRILNFDENGAVTMEDPLLIEDKQSATFAWGSKNLQHYGGKYYLIYDANVDGDNDTYLRTSTDGINWSARAEISDGPAGTDQRYPKMVIGGDLASPDICVAWHDSRGAQVQVHAAVSSDGGQSWSASQTISNHLDSRQVMIDMARDAAGNLYLAWNRHQIDYQVFSTWFSKSTDGGASWTAQYELHTSNEWSYPCQVVAGAPGQVMIGINHVEFISGWTNNLTIYNSTDGGEQWTSGARPTAYSGTGSFRFFVMATAPDGNVHFTHCKTKDGAPEKYLHTSSADWAQSWQSMTAVSDTTYDKLQNNDGYYSMPALAFSPGGNIYVGWSDARNNLTEENYEVYLSRSTNNGQHWSDNLIVNGDTSLAAQRYPIIAATEDGSSDKILVVYQEVHEVPVGIAPIGNGKIPDAFSLSQNYPNPFNPSTHFSFRVSSLQHGGSKVAIQIFDLQGRLVKTIVDQALAPGEYTASWNGHNDTGEQVASGVYLYRITAGDFFATRKMILLR